MGKKTKVPTKVAKAAERKIDPALMPPPPPTGLLKLIQAKDDLTDENHLPSIHP